MRGYKNEVSKELRPARNQKCSCLKCFSRLLNVNPGAEMLFKQHRRLALDSDVLERYSSQGSLSRNSVASYARGLACMAFWSCLLYVFFFVGCVKLKQTL